MIKWESIQTDGTHNRSEFMSLIDKLKTNTKAFSLEFSPPKKDMPLDTVYGAIEKLSVYNPEFVSITYGAGGSNRDRTVEVASHVSDLGLEAIAHLTCVGADPDQINNVLDTLQKKGIHNILALRGDIPQGMDRSTAFAHYQHASDLLVDIKKRKEFVVGAAAYPEAHFEADTLCDDIKFMKLKADLGADFFVTQLCFDKNALLDFHEKAYKAGITTPISTGIMPVLDPKQIIRMTLLSACSIPATLSRLVSRYGEDVDSFKKAGIDYAVQEITDLMAGGINKFHLYVMNKADETTQILKMSGLI
jgi:methylenetetrahydrofolate reductase (NADPH)